MKDYKTVVGINIKRFRESKGMSQEELANACGHKSNGARSWISKIESGKRNTTTDELANIAKILGISPSRLFAPPEMSFIDEKRNIVIDAEAIRLDQPSVRKHVKVYVSKSLGMKAAKTKKQA